jgi:hypothetical protein
MPLKYIVPINGYVDDKSLEINAALGMAEILCSGKLW